MAISNAQASMLRRLIRQEHEYHMARIHDRSIPLGRNNYELRTARSLAELNLCEVRGGHAYLGTHLHEA